VILIILFTISLVSRSISTPDLLSIRVSQLLLVWQKKVSHALDEVPLNMANALCLLYLTKVYCLCVCTWMDRPEHNAWRSVSVGVWRHNATKVKCWRSSQLAHLLHRCSCRPVCLWSVRWNDLSGCQPTCLLSIHMQSAPVGMMRHPKMIKSVHRDTGNGMHCIIKLLK